jgi:branched-chain amino acid transport system ATP-binding protein
MRQALEGVDQILERVGLGPKRNLAATQLTVADRKRLEIAKALAAGPRLLLLDEVMAGLNLAEVEGVMALIRDLRSSGTTLLVIEHVMKAIMGVSDRIIVLHHGKKLAEGSPTEVANHPDVLREYLGSRFARRVGAGGGLEPGDAQR